MTPISLNLMTSTVHDGTPQPWPRGISALIAEFAMPNDRWVQQHNSSYLRIAEDGNKVTYSKEIAPHNMDAFPTSWNVFSAETYETGVHEWCINGFECYAFGVSGDLGAGNEFLSGEFRLTCNRLGNLVQGTNGMPSLLFEQRLPSRSTIYCKFDLNCQPRIVQWRTNDLPWTAPKQLHPNIRQVRFIATLLWPGTSVSLVSAECRHVL